MVGPRVRVTPWSCTNEWSAVRDLVVGRHPTALSHLMVWSSRVGRLPAGVETTVSLLQAHLLNPHTPLSIATAVNRFLNHISHLGMALWDVSRLHEAASRLSVPEWVVEVRHETTHGAMPTITLLRAAMHFALTWLDTHYWKEVQEGEVEEKEGDRIGGLLELYKYLKVYQLWGTVALLDIKEQGEVWDHLQGLWDQVMSGRDLVRLSVKQSVGLVKTEIVNLLREEEEEGLERLARILVEEELLIPDKEFLESLEEEEGVKKGGEVSVPKQLQKLWTELVGLIDRGLGVAALIDRLMERVGNEGGGDAALLSGAWVVLLAEGMLGRGGKLIPITSSTVAEARLEKWLAVANPVVSQLTGLLCQVAGLEESRRRKVELLVRTAANPPEVRAGEGRVRSLVDLTELNTVGEEERKVDEGGWVKDVKQSWDTVTLGGWQGQSWEALWVEGEWAKEDTEEDLENLPDFHIDAIDWSKANGQKRKVEEKQGVAHFYSDKPTKLSRLLGANRWKNSKSPKRQRRS